MGKWATYRKRGRGSQGPSYALPVPLLALAIGDQLNWGVVGAAPVNAEVWYDGGGGFGLAATVDWTAGQPYDASATPGDWKVRGVDGSSVPVTDFSNIVTN